MQNNPQFRSASSHITGLVLPDAATPFVIVNPFSNYGFKKAFHNPVVLLEFLNLIFNYEGSDQVVEVCYIEKDFPNLDLLGYFDFRIVVVCKSQNDRYFLVDMQSDYTKDYLNNANIDFAKFISRIKREMIDDIFIRNHRRRLMGDIYVDSREFWDRIEMVYLFNMSNMKHSPESTQIYYEEEYVAEPDVLNNYEMIQMRYPTSHLRKLKAKLVLLMLSNFRKTIDQLETNLDRWLFALKDEELSTGIPRINPFKNISDIATVAYGSQALQLFYSELYIKNIESNSFDTYSRIMQQTNETFDQLFAAGCHRDGIFRIVKSLKEQQIEPSVIAMATGISVEEIEQV